MSGGKHADRPGLIPGLVFVTSASSTRLPENRGIVIRLDETGQRCVEIGRSPRPTSHAVLAHRDHEHISFLNSPMLTGDDFIDRYSNPGLISRNT